MSEFFRYLPCLSIIFHVSLNIINSFNDIKRSLFDILISGNSFFIFSFTFIWSGEHPLLSPLIFFFFFSHILIINISWILHASFSSIVLTSCTTFLLVFHLLLNSSYFTLSFISEDSFNSWNNSCLLYNLLYER
jgi:hypothetical protein